jgi:transposase, IS5 family
VFGYKNHVGIDRQFGFLRRCTVTHGAAYDGGQLGAVLDRDNTASGVRADTAYRSAANLELLNRRGLKPQFQRKKPRGRRCRRTSPAAIPPALVCDRASSMSSPPRKPAGPPRAHRRVVHARVKIGVANLAYNFTGRPGSASEPGRRSCANLCRAAANRQILSQRLGGRPRKRSYLRWTATTTLEWHST